MPTPLLDRPKNCMASYENISGKFYIDGAEYFEALYNAFVRAQKSIYILGWDINTRLKLIRRFDTAKGLPVILGDLLCTLAKKKGIEIKILTWDFPTFYILERELFSKLRIHWAYSQNIDFVYDDNHPLMASHHQKIVIVDEQVAFCGGLDLTSDRWDTSDHAPQDPRRVNTNGRPYSPFHDVQVGINGSAVKGLSEIFKFRWKNATGEELKSTNVSTSRRFITDPDFTSAKVGISRTSPAFKESPLVTEVRQIHLDMIQQTKRFLYIENQYFTSDEIAEAIELSLEQPSGPYVCIVLPQRNNGWFETKALSSKQSIIIKRLRDRDIHKRLDVFYPEIPNLDKNFYLKVHSKLMVSDDRFVLVGSSNLTRRSMLLDSECDLTIEATNDQTRESLFEFQSRLISEHSGLQVGAVRDLLRTGNYEKLVNELRKRESIENERCLRYLPDFNIKAPPNSALELIDSETPTKFDQFLDRYITTKFKPRRQQFKRWLRRFSIAIAVVSLILLVWKYNPFPFIFDQTNLREVISAMEHTEFSFIYVVSIFIFFSIAFVPLNLLILATATFQEGWIAISTIVIGSIISASATYMIGFFLGVRYIKKRWPRIFKRLEKTLIVRKILPVVIIRIVPIAPFGVVNLLCGAVQVCFWRYLIGTFLGILPGTISLVLFQKSLITVIMEPNLRHIFILIALVFTFGVFYRFATKRITL